MNSDDCLQYRSGNLRVLIFSFNLREFHEEDKFTNSGKKEKEKLANSKLRETLKIKN